MPNKPGFTKPQGARGALAGAQACAEVVFLFPVAVAVAVLFVRPMFIWAWLLLLFVFALVGAWLAPAARRGGFVPAVVLPAAIIASGSAVALVGRGPIVGIVGCALAGLVVWLRGAHHRRSVITTPSVLLSLFGLALHFAAFYVFSLFAWLHDWIPVITISALLTVAVAFFTINGQHFDQLLLDRDRLRGLPQAMVRYNRRLLAACVGFLWVLFGVGMLIFGMTRLQFSATSTTTSQPVLPNLPQRLRPPQQPAAPPTAKTTGHTAVWVIWLRDVVAGVLLAAFLFFLARFVWKRVIPGLLAWYQRINRPLTAADEGYVDEVESLARDTRLRHRWLRSPKRRHAHAVSTLTADDVRQLYRQLVSIATARGYVWDASRTAAETLADIERWQNSVNTQAVVVSDRVIEVMVPLYDAARYGEVDISPAQIDRLKRVLANLQSSATGRILNFD